MEAVLGNSIGVFIGVTCVLAGGAAVMTGQALAQSWRPLWMMLVYGLLLGGADRFIVYALFQGELLSPGGFVIDTLVVIAVGVVAFRVTLVAKMVSQYPWLYRRSGLFAWRRVEGHGQGPA